jgi:hypothetical protein
MQHIESNEVLSIIESGENTNKNTNKTRLQRFFLGIVMFIVIAITCQGG